MTKRRTVGGTHRRTQQRRPVPAATDPLMSAVKEAVRTGRVPRWWKPRIELTRAERGQIQRALARYQREQWNQEERVVMRRLLLWPGLGAEVMSQE